MCKHCDEAVEKLKGKLIYDFCKEWKELSNEFPKDDSIAFKPPDCEEAQWACLCPVCGEGICWDCV